MPSLSRLALSPLLATLGVIALSACHPSRGEGLGYSLHHTGEIDDRPTTVNATLACPLVEGELKRVLAAPDGASCRYLDENGATIDLKILALNGSSPTSALQPLEAELSSLVALGGSTNVVAVDTQAGAHGQDRTRVDLPGLHVHADGDQADVSILGAHIRSGGRPMDPSADGRQSTTQVHAGPGGAEVRANRTGRNVVSLIYVRSGRAAGRDGIKAAGYEARGPVDGPLVVAAFRSPHGRHWEGGRDVRRLLALNVRPVG